MPVHNKNLVIEPDKVKEVSDGGIIIPEKSQDPPTSGVIKLTGSSEFPIGTRVYYPNYSITPMILPLLSKTQTFHIVKEEEILYSEDAETLWNNKESNE